LTVTLVLLQIFPRILNVEYINQEWETVADTIERFGQIGAFVHRSGKAGPSHIHLPYDNDSALAIDEGRLPEGGQA